MDSQPSKSGARPLEDASGGLIDRHREDSAPRIVQEANLQNLLGHTRVRVDVVRL
jgi:hypothetical protein